MKRVFICIIFLFALNNIHSTNIPLDRIKKELLSFLISNGDCSEDFTIEDIPDQIIINPLKETHIHEGSDGVFFIRNFSAHSYIHYLLINNEGYRIINMRNPLEDNLKILIDFLEKDISYNRKDVLFYILNMIEVYKQNMKREENGSIQLIN